MRTRVRLAQIPARQGPRPAVGCLDIGGTLLGAAHLLRECLPTRRRARVPGFGAHRDRSACRAPHAARPGAARRAAATLRPPSAGTRHRRDVAERGLRSARRPALGRFDDRAAARASATSSSSRPVSLDEARRVLDAELSAIDVACSRFRDDSDLARINRAGGATVAVSELCVIAIEVALRAARDGRRCRPDDRPGGAGGRVRPETSRPCPRRSRPAESSARHVSAWQQVVVDPLPLDRHRARRRRARSRRDRQGAGRRSRSSRPASQPSGWERWSAWVATSPPPGRHRDGWRMRRDDDRRTPLESVAQTVSLVSGGLATSSTTVRRWRVGDGTAHHVIDPHTARSAAGRWRTVSVAAASCIDANIASTAAIIRSERAPGWLAALGLPGPAGDHGRRRRVRGRLARRGSGGVTALVINSSTLWYLTRGTGVVSLLLLTSSVALGVVGAVGWSAPGWPRFLTTGLHRNLSLLVLAFSPCTSEPRVRQLRTDHPRPGGDPVHLDVPPDLARAGRARVRHAACDPHHESRPEVAWLSCLADDPLACVCQLAGGGRAWTWHRHGHEVHVDDRPDRRLRGDRGRMRVVAGKHRLAVRAWPVGRRSRRASRVPLIIGWVVRHRPAASGMVASRRDAENRADPQRGGEPGLTDVETIADVPGAPFTGRILGSLTETSPDQTGTVTVAIAARVTGGARASLAVTLRGQPLSDRTIQIDSGTITFGPPSHPSRTRARSSWPPTGVWWPR